VAGQLAAALSLEMTNRLNAMLTSAYGAAGVKVADVSGAFATNDTAMGSEPGVGRVPQNVARICRWTWMCAHNPPDVHGNAPGYQVMADAFYRVH
jgi:hypothetical protein